MLSEGGRVLKGKRGRRGKGMEDERSSSASKVLLYERAKTRRAKREKKGEMEKGRLAR